ncbi:carbonic anhydrase [bacterium]|nr:carbonic anhydrase [bacterium]
MDANELTRRGMIQFGAAASIATVMNSDVRAQDLTAFPDEGMPATPEEALERLKEGNARFASGKVRHAHEAANWRKQLTLQQAPFATILGCSDSRVPIELVFDQGFGDIFVIRVAGNVISPDVEGSLQYALLHLKTPLIVVLGHQGCGAVTASLAEMDGKANEPRLINDLTKLIIPGLKGLNPALAGASRLAAAVQANVYWAMEQLKQIPEGQIHLNDKKVKLVGGIYQLDSGRVQFLD